MRTSWSRSGASGIGSSSRDSAGKHVVALTIAFTVGGKSENLTLEVQQHLGGGLARAIAMSSSEGLKRGMAVVDTGSPISVPVGNGILGRILDVTGAPVDGAKVAWRVTRMTRLPLVQLLWLSGQPYDQEAAGTGLTYDQMATAKGLTAHNFHQVPFVAFNRKDTLQHSFVAKAFKLPRVILKQLFVPSSEGQIRAVAAGWGVSVVPELGVRERLASGELVNLLPRHRLDVPLHWHCWNLHSDVLEALTAALRTAARRSLRPPARAAQGA